MEVTLLGTGSPIPSADRAGPATLVRAGAANILVDCGRGVSMRLQAAGAPAPSLSAVLLTHMHSDHVTDLNDIITTHWIMSPEPRPLRVFGPVGAVQLVEATLAMLAFDVKYRIDHHADLHEGPRVETVELVPGQKVSVGEAEIGAYETNHSPVSPTLGYRIDHKGLSVALAGDTIPCPGLDEMCAGVDVYVQTVIRDDFVRRVPSKRFQDILDYHSTVEQAAQTAARARVATLMMTHYVPPMMAGQEEQWRALARAHFNGAIVVGDDLTSVTIPPRAAP